MNRFNTELPKVELPEPPKKSWFTKYHLWGYAFLALTFLLIVGFIYQMEYGKKPQESRICIQVVTTARSPYSGETKEFPTPCDVPEGWEVVPGVYNEIPNIDLDETQVEKPQPYTYQNPTFGYEITYDVAKLEIRDRVDDNIILDYKGYCECQPITINISNRAFQEVENEINTLANQSLAKDAYARKEIKIAGVSAVKISYSLDIGGTMNNIIFVRAGKTYLITSEESEEFNPVIESFKFIR